MTEKDVSTYHYWFPGGFLGTAGPLSAPNILRRGGARGAVACGWIFSNDSFWRLKNKTKKRQKNDDWGVYPLIIQ